MRLAALNQLTMMHFKALHYWVGILGIVAFVLTGQHMANTLGGLVDIPDGPRMIYRSAHLYLLLCSVLNLALGVYWSEQVGTLRRLAQRVTSIMILVSPALMLLGFFLEPSLGDLTRTYTRVANYGLFGSTVLLGWLGFRR